MTNSNLQYYVTSKHICSQQKQFNVFSVKAELLRIANQGAILVGILTNAFWSGITSILVSEMDSSSLKTSIKKKDHLYRPNITHFIAV